MVEASRTQLRIAIPCLLLWLLSVTTDRGVAQSSPPRVIARASAHDVRPVRARARPAPRVVPLADRIPHVPGGAPIVISPVLFVPSDLTYDREAEADAAMRAHVRIAQEHYRRLLGTSFAASAATLPIVQGAHTAAEYEADSAWRSHWITRELFAWARTDRYRSHHLFVVLYVSATAIDGGGIPFNGTLGTGGGYVELDARALFGDEPYPFQSSLVHEIGHALGLDHVACRGESMDVSPSLMSYDPSHHSAGLSPSADPGTFLPIEIAALALSRRALPNLRASWTPTSEAELAQAEACLLPAMSDAIGPFRAMPGVGLEMFYGARHVSGEDASLYSRAQAIQTCRQSRTMYPRTRVRCLYNGEPLSF